MDSDLASLVVLVLWLVLIISAVWFEDWYRKRRSVERERLEREIAAQEVEIRRRFEARSSELSLGAHKARRALLRASFEAAKNRTRQSK